jgi:hypothetical protein
VPFSKSHFIGKAVPMTVITPVRRSRRLLTRLILFIFKHLPLGIVKDLAFIHFARWILVPANKLPSLSPDQPKEDWQDDLYIFSTNFNGSWDQYIDAFGRIKAVSKGLNMLWYTSTGFPGPWPMRLFKRYVHYYELPLDLYYNAYPGAAVRDIGAALQLAPHFDSFLEQADRDLTSDEFAVHYNKFVSEAAPFLGTIGVEADEQTHTHRAQPMEFGT